MSQTEGGVEEKVGNFFKRTFFSDVGQMVRKKKMKERN